MRLTASVQRADMLRYLGYADQAIDSNMEARIQRAIDLCERELIPTGVYGIFPVASAESKAAAVSLVGTSLVLPGAAIRKHLQGAVEVALMAVTLGLESERVLRQEAALSATDGLLVDAAASSLVDEAAEALEQEIARQATRVGLRAGHRFSPGYGDLPLLVQPEFLRTIQTDKLLGMSVTEGCLLVPSKSVTAVVGLFPVTEKPANAAEPKLDLCSLCSMNASCTLRREGRTCHGS